MYSFGLSFDTLLWSCHVLIFSELIGRIICGLQLEFCSFNVDDEDYMGYDYSIIGQLSEVRIVYLNRFIQEVMQL